MRILVTGGTGFLGSHVVDKLRSQNHDVFVPRVSIADTKYPPSKYDLRNKEDVFALLSESKPEVVIHLAAVCGGIGANQKRPAEFFYDNLAMGMNLIDAANAVGVKKFVQVGTVCSYPKFCPVPFREKDLWNGHPEETNAPYGIAKRALLTMCQAYRAQYGFNAVYLIPVNLYGPRDNFDPETSHVIPALIKKCVDAKRNGDKEIVVWGDGTATREFLYVEDAAGAIIAATERYDSGEPINIGSGTEISIEALVNEVSYVVGYKGDVVYDSGKPNGQPRRRLDVTRAKELFGWESRTPLGEGLRKTVEWYLKEGKL
jgi:GDP-L-fucose synthase